MSLPGARPDKGIRLLILAANFLICFSLSFLISGRGGDADQKSGHPGPVEAPAPRPAASRRTNSRPEKPENLLYTGAYEKILRSGYNTSSQTTLKQEWLKRWLAADPRAALNFYYRNRDSFAGADMILREYYRAHGDQALSSLLAGDFGLYSRRAAFDLFYSSGAVLDRDRVIDFVKTGGSEARRTALAYLAKDAGATPQSVEAVVKLFSGLDTDARADAFSMLGDELKRKNPAAMKDLLLSGQLDPASPEYAALAERYSWTLNELPVADILKAVSEFPAAAQDNLAKQTLSIAKSRAMANAETLIASTDILLQAGKYSVAEEWIESGSQTHLDSVRLSEWALALPQDSQHEKLFQSAVSGYLGEDPGHGKDWVDSLANGWQKNQALQQLAKVTRDNPKYAEVYQWAAKQAGGQ